MPKVFISTSSFGVHDPTPLQDLRAQGHEDILNPYRRTLSEEEIQRLLQEHRPVGLIAGVEPLTERVIGEAAPYLRVISRVGVGLDNIDLAAAKLHDIRVYRTPDAPTRAVVELTIGLILSLLRSIPRLHQAMERGSWNKESGTLLFDKRVGIVGWGRIGKAVGRILHELGARVCFFDPYVDSPDVNFSKVSWDELLATSDVISLHAAAEDVAKPLLGREEFAKMKPGVYLVNTARGKLIDEEALCRALESKVVKAAALDVYCREPYQGPLAALPNVILTPHIGSATVETRSAMEREAVKNLLVGLSSLAVS